MRLGKTYTDIDQIKAGFTYKREIGNPLLSVDFVTMCYSTVIKLWPALFQEK